MKLTAAIFLVFPAFCQTAPAPLAFEVASVKPAELQKGPGMRIGVIQDKGRITISGMSLKMLLMRAYEVKEHQLIGPDWLDTERYDIVAKLPEGATKDQVPQMLKTLLADRFKVIIHKESKVMPVYALVVAKGGPRLKDAEAEGGLRMMMSPQGRKMSGNAPLSRLAEILSSTIDRTVLDMTELKGVYEIDLTWSPDDTDRVGAKMALIGPGGPRSEHAEESKSGDGPDAPTIFIALQEQLGLKLEARKLPVDIVVVDHAEKIATEN